MGIIRHGLVRNRYTSARAIMMLGTLWGKNASTSNRRLPRMRDRTTYHEIRVHSRMVTVGATSASTRVLARAVAAWGLVNTTAYASKVMRPRACTVGTL